MKLKDLTDVLTFASFRPEPDDGSAAWTRRFPGRRTLLLNVGKNQTSWRGLARGGRLVESGSQKGDFKDVASSLAAEWRRLTDDGWCCVSLNNRYVISLESNIARREGIEDTIRTNPRAVLGSKFERGKRYALISNPEHGTSIVLSCEEEVVKKAEAALAEAGLRAGRICCGTYTMLRRAVEHANDGSRPPNAPGPNRLFVICCAGSVCLLTQSGDAWSDLRSRTDIYDSDTAAVIEIISPASRHGDSQLEEILFAADQPGSDIPARLAEKFPRVKITDLTGDDHLWSLIADLR